MRFLENNPVKLASVLANIGSAVTFHSAVLILGYFD
ncbi:hypothetical protein SLEP1_g39435 [Rubroshorea leprosula]|uniref:Uncharacterized protein n=1 Tax=Rubroshorea leprosula TaxID=152421 RepID=A0AAV5L070_9ROSI|nr:hypothetical protein SLEP1_g39435 [Rubroshorea leprosula]